MKVPMKIIISPMLTEKTTRLKDRENKYVFKVAMGATKREIATAVEELFKVKVVDVRTMRYLGKLRRYGRMTGRKASWKKAVVELEKGATLPVFEGI